MQVRFGMTQLNSAQLGGATRSFRQPPERCALFRRLLCFDLVESSIKSTRRKRILTRRIAYIVVAAVFAACVSPCQQTSNNQGQDQQQESKRILGIVPNYRTSP